MTAVTESTIWAVVVAVSLVTYGLRASFLFGIDYFEAFPPTVDRLLSFFPIGILSALVVPGLLFVDGTLVLAPGNARLVAGLVAFVVAWYTESLLATVGVGMGALWVLLAVA